MPFKFKGYAPVYEWEDGKQTSESSSACVGCIFIMGMMVLMIYGPIIIHGQLSINFDSQKFCEQQMMGYTVSSCYYGYNNYNFKCCQLSCSVDQGNPTVYYVDCDGCEYSGYSLSTGIAFTTISYGLLFIICCFYCCLLIKKSNNVHNNAYKELGNDTHNNQTEEQKTATNVAVISEFIEMANSMNPGKCSTFIQKYYSNDYWGIHDNLDGSKGVASYKQDAINFWNIWSVKKDYMGLYNIKIIHSSPTSVVYQYVARYSKIGGHIDYSLMATMEFKRPGLIKSGYFKFIN